ncbi:MAG: hypothetical protein KGH61_05660 [Candidatus Micrarchaeota archaeon]|nr:hypothetical protein [Candidatus Micrarchaeota archaeon]MDE1848400.1 hypothetical protein [Candidatus Micrarchaeota archaeon]
MIPAENDTRSRSLLGSDVPLFEAGFIHPDGRCYTRADILVTVSGFLGSLFDLLEVKSSTSVKEYHLEDIAFQKYCYEGAGVKIRTQTAQIYKCFSLQ